MKNNYDLVMQNIIDNLTSKPNLLLHSCCGPCSSAVIERLKEHFNITVYYYNPNIEPQMEYEKRKKEQIRLLNILNIEILDCDYDNESFKTISKGLEEEKEGGSRCFKCFELRLQKTALKALENNFDFFGTTLTVSPYKNSEIINQIGKEIEEKNNIKFLYSDFKKHEGYKRSIELAKKYELYRQDYCGCIFSQNKNYVK